MKDYNYGEVTDAREKELFKLSVEKLNAPMSSDPATGIQQIADLLTCLPEEERETAVRSMIASMLCG